MFPVFKFQIDILLFYDILAIETKNRYFQEKDMNYIKTLLLSLLCISNGIYGMQKPEKSLATPQEQSSFSPSKIAILSSITIAGLGALAYYYLRKPVKYIATFVRGQKKDILSLEDNLEDTRDPLTLNTLEETIIQSEKNKLPCIIARTKTIIKNSQTNENTIKHHYFDAATFNQWLFCDSLLNADISLSNNGEIKITGSKKYPINKMIAHPQKTKLKLNQTAIDQRRVLLAITLGIQNFNPPIEDIINPATKKPIKGDDIHYFIKYPAIFDMQSTEYNSYFQYLCNSSELLESAELQNIMHVIQEDDLALQVKALDEAFKAEDENKTLIDLCLLYKAAHQNTVLEMQHMAKFLLFNSLFNNTHGIHNKYEAIEWLRESAQQNTVPAIKNNAIHILKTIERYGPKALDHLHIYKKPMVQK